MRQGAVQRGTGMEPEVFQRWGRGEEGATAQGMIVQPKLGQIAARCQRPFVATSPTTLIVRCNEGQYAWEEAAVLAALGICESPDTATPPGGAGAFHLVTAALSTIRAREEERLMVAIRDHGLQRIVLVNHEGCRHYAARLRGRSPRDMQRRQLGDLMEVAARFHEMFPAVQRIDTFYACVEAGRLVLRHVEWEERVAQATAVARAS